MINCKSLVGSLIASLLAASAHADLNVSILAYAAHQEGVTAAAVVGNVVNAHTNLGSVWARAGYRLECSDPAIRPALTGSRAWSDNGLAGPRQVTVTSPENYPSKLGLPGWNNVMSGTAFDCVFSFNGEAKNSLFPIGSGGATVSLGGEHWEYSGSITFPMIKMGTLWGGKCIM